MSPAFFRQNEFSIFLEDGTVIYPLYNFVQQSVENEDDVMDVHAKKKTIKENNQFDLAAKEPTKMPKEKKSGMI